MSPPSHTAATNADLRNQLTSVRKKLADITNLAQNLIDKDVVGAKTACKDIVKCVEMCENIHDKAETNIDKMNLVGCSGYALTWIIHSNKLNILHGENKSVAPNLQTRHANVDGRILIPLPAANADLYTATEACEILEKNKGKGKILIQFFIKNNYIPVKQAMMCRLLDIYKKIKRSRT